MANLLEEEVEEVLPPHPYDSVLGEKVNSMIQQNTGGVVIGLNFQQFKEIQWPKVFPYFICDLIYTMTGFSMVQELQDRASRKQEEERNV